MLFVLGFAPKITVICEYLTKCFD